jgi:hypothetical protein
VPSTKEEDIMEEERERERKRERELDNTKRCDYDDD